MQNNKFGMSKTRRMYFLRLVGRCIIFFIMTLIYVFDKDEFNVAEGWGFFKDFSLLHIMWGYGCGI